MTFRADFERRDDLLRAALDEFCQRGYDAASINRILLASGMSKGQLYHHFAGKTGLYLALVEWMIDRKAAWFAEHPVAPGYDLVATLGAHLRATVEFAAAHPEVDRLSRALLAERGRPIFAEATQRFGFDPDSALAGLVARDYESGRIRSDLSLAFVTRAVLLIVNHLPELLELGQPKELGPRIEELLAFLEAGLLASPTSPG